LIRQEIVWRLLNGPLGATLRQVGLADGHAARIRRVTAHIRDHDTEPLRVADLAALVHMSVSSFHRHFKAATTLTPVPFHKQIRLPEARRLLIGVEDVAGVGYESSSAATVTACSVHRPAATARRSAWRSRRDGAAFRVAFTLEIALP
jgi:AraC-like DNA-binding protein